MPFDEDGAVQLTARLAMMTLREIALKAGVSTSTVSRALRNDPRLPPATCLRLQALSESLGYRPNPLLVALMDHRWKRGSHEAGTLAWVNALPPHDRFSQFHVRVLAGATARAKTLGYQLEEFSLRDSGMTGGRLSQILTNRGIRGLCMGPLPKGHGHIRMKWESFSCATVGYTMVRPNLHRVTPHHMQGVLEGLRQLRRLNYKRIGVWMTEEENRKVSYNWMAGAWLYSKLNPGIACPLMTGDWSSRAFGEWIEREKLDCVLGSSEVVKRWKDELKLKVPVATLSWHPRLAISGMDQKPAEIGAAAIDLIVGQLRRNESGIPKIARVVMVEGEWQGG